MTDGSRNSDGFLAGALSFASAAPRVRGMNPLVERVFGPLLTVHQWLYEVSDGRIGATIGGRPMLLLRTIGRRSRQPRTAALLYVRDGDAYVVIASKGGAPQHPAWFHNLTSQPDVEIQVGRAAHPGARPRRRGRRTHATLGARRRGQPRSVRHLPIAHEARHPGRPARTARMTPKASQSTADYADEGRISRRLLRRDPQPFTLQLNAFRA